MGDNKKVMLRAGDKTQEFEPEHAARLLAYPGTQWSELPAEKTVADKKPAAKDEVGK